MKRNKILFLLQQILIIASYCYIILYDEGFIFRESMKPTLIFAMAFFHTGTISSFYVTIVSVDFSKQKEEFLFNFNMFIYSGTMTLLMYHNCQMLTTQLIVYYFFGLFTLCYTLYFLLETYNSYIIYKSTQIINPKNQ